MEGRGFTRIVALGIVLAAVCAESASAGAGADVAVIVVPASSPVFVSPRAAHGLMVVGEGATISRRGALASLLTGEVGNAVLHGGIPRGRPRITLARHAARTTFYVALPPPGRHHNVVRYPIAVVGPGYHGLLTSSGTHVAGLIAIWDVAPSARSLARGEQPRIGSRPALDPVGYLKRFDRRLSRAHDSRSGATLAVIGLMAGLGLLTLASRSASLGRAAFLAAPACLVVSLVLSAADVTAPTEVVVLMTLIGCGLALVCGALLRPRLPLALGLLALFAFVFAVLWAEPSWNSVAALGARPDGGGRFYGINNQVATGLLCPALVLGALSGPGALPAVALAVSAGIGVSSIGANGGCLLTYLAGFLVLGFRFRAARAGPLRVAAAAAVVAAAALALVGIDAALGGSSHVTHAVGGGPGALAGDFAHRLHLSAAFIASRWYEALLFAVSVAALVWLAFRRPRLAVLDALLVALAVSLLVNDTPTDIAVLGALSALVLYAWLRRSGERLASLD